MIHPAARSCDAGHIKVPVEFIDGSKDNAKPWAGQITRGQQGGVQVASEGKSPQSPHPATKGAAATRSAFSLDQPRAPTGASIALAKFDQSFPAPPYQGQRPVPSAPALSRIRSTIGYRCLHRRFANARQKTSIRIRAGGPFCPRRSKQGLRSAARFARPASPHSP